MSFVYKLLMNSLYGRFGINPKSTKTIIGDINEYNSRMRHESWIDGHLLAENKYLIIYHTNIDNTIDRWDPPNIDKNSKDLMSINTDSNLNEEIMRLYIDEDSEGSNLKLEENTKTDDKKPDT